MPQPFETASGSGHPAARVRPLREVTGMSAVLLPFDERGAIDRDGFLRHLQRTVDAGLVPAVNMDTGYAQHLDARTRRELLALAADHVEGRFVAGAHVLDEPGAAFHLDAYATELEEIQRRGGLPIVFPSHGLNALDRDDWVRAHERFGGLCEQFLAFELGEAFVSYGRIYPLEAYQGLLEVPACVGAKHSSLRRRDEWERLGVRDRVRPEFLVLSGNDLAIDMVMYGSDYLLGLSTFDPAAFAHRDRLWTTGDPDFYELNDLLQYLGQFTFRTPVPAYRHSAAQFLQLRGWIDADAIPAGVPRRPDSDRPVLEEIARRLEAWHA